MKESPSYFPEFDPGKTNSAPSEKEKDRMEKEDAVPTENSYLVKCLVECKKWAPATLTERREKLRDGDLCKTLYEHFIDESVCPEVKPYIAMMVYSRMNMLDDLKVANERIYELQTLVRSVRAKSDYLKEQMVAVEAISRRATKSNDYCKYAKEREEKRKRELDMAQIRLRNAVRAKRPRTTETPLPVVVVQAGKDAQ